MRRQLYGVSKTSHHVKLAHASQGHKRVTIDIKGISSLTIDIETSNPHEHLQQPLVLLLQVDSTNVHVACIKMRQKHCTHAQNQRQVSTPPAPQTRPLCHHHQQDAPPWQVQQGSAPPQYCGRPHNASQCNRRTGPGTALGTVR